MSWGGFAAGIICFLIILKIYKESFAPWLDILGISALAGIGVGRIGSFLSGELAGRSSDSFIAVRGVYPVTLVEAVILMAAFGLFLILFWYKRIAEAGYYFLFVVLFYCLVRFGLDFLRVDSIVWLGLTLSQIVSAVISLLIIIYIFIRMFLSKRGVRYA